jgi:ATP-dependent DNA ligase
MPERPDPDVSSGTHGGSGFDQRRAPRMFRVVTPLMLATLTDRRDFGDDWLLERKFDGERCEARKTGGDVQLESRTGKDLTSTYPEEWGRGGSTVSGPAARRRGRGLRR